MEESREGEKEIVYLRELVDDTQVGGCSVCVGREFERTPFVCNLLQC